MTTEPFAIEIGGATLAGLERGEGLPVVFLHAGVCDKRMWLDQMQAVDEAGWHAIAYDRRGYGETTSPDEAFSHLDDLEALLDALDIHAAVLVGCSMGGGLAVDFALAHPGRVIGLVLIGTSITGAPWSATAEERAIEMAEEDAWERGDLDLLNKVQAHEWLDGPRAQSGRVGDPARALFFDMNAKALGKPQLTLEEERPDAWTRLEDVNTPALLMVGDEDFTALIDRHETLSETMPNAFAVMLEGVAHIPSIEKPELVNALILEFLDALAGEDDDVDSED
ncbi:alpha/beta fold hydrolase [Devosia sediminis]|uniref:Alpha/beta hydrolase n=1 Tax=Devosia sediminis TaxID=2798801 RepID=A0A934MPV5_9HYPH|nr:alpha/beta hydrolase [Devosia sediminis]MBJ3783724.1 alpha/beta hydrolase [Devosia sediminis]